MTSASFLDVQYIDGYESRLKPARLQWIDGQFHLSGNGFERIIPPQDIAWPENLGQPVLVAHLSDGGQLQSLSVDQWEAWLNQYIGPKAWIAKAQTSRKWAVAAVLGLVIFAFGFWRWGIDWTAQLAVALTPMSVDVNVGQSTIAAMDRTLLKPSQLTDEQKTEVQKAFDALAAVAKQRQQRVNLANTDDLPAYQLHFRSSVIGPNAFAVPGGGIVMTDQMVKLLKDEPDALTGVLAHEIGHVVHRHGLLLMYKSGAVALVIDYVFGDVSSILTTLPALLTQASYSRNAERQADQMAADLLKEMGRSPLAMVTLFEKLQAFLKQESDQHESGDQEERYVDKLGISFSSHPSDTDRIQFFKQQAGQ